MSVIYEKIHAKRVFKIFGQPLIFNPEIITREIITRSSHSFTKCNGKEVEIQGHGTLIIDGQPADLSRLPSQRKTFYFNRGRKQGWVINIFKLVKDSTTQ